MMEIKEVLIKRGTAAREGRALRKFTGVTIHNTDNYKSGAGAYNHMIYMTVNGGANKYASYQYVLDDKECYRLIPEGEVAWHAGDGDQGPGNNETVAIEICVNPESNFNDAFERAALLTAEILHRKGIKVSEGYVFQHNYWSGKNCPAEIIKNGIWPRFIKTVQIHLDNFNRPPETSKAIYRVIVDGKQIGAYSIADNALKEVLNGINKKARVIQVNLVE